jgi:hypothetical protein
VVEFCGTKLLLKEVEMRAVTGGLVGLLCIVLSVAVRGQDVGFASAWPELTAADQDQVQKFGDDVKTFLGQAKSEMLFVRNATQFAESNGFRKWDSATAAGSLKAGSRWYAINRDRTRSEERREGKEGQSKWRARGRREKEEKK